MANFRHVTKCRGGSGGDLPSFLPSGPLPHAEAGAFPDLETLGVPSLLCTRVSFELCAYKGLAQKHDFALPCTDLLGLGGGMNGHMAAGKLADNRGRVRLD